jgi:hypothetical protein
LTLPDVRQVLEKLYSGCYSMGPEAVIVTQPLLGSGSPLLAECCGPGLGRRQTVEGQRCVPWREGERRPVTFTVTVSPSVVSQAGFVVTLEAQVRLLSLDSGLARASAVSWHPEDYEALSAASADSGAVLAVLGGKHQVYSYSVQFSLLCRFFEPQKYRLLNGCLVRIKGQK